VSAVDRPPDPAGTVGSTLPPGGAPAADAGREPLDVRAERRRRRREFIRALVRSKTFLVGAILVVFWVLDALLWRTYVPYPPEAVDAGAAPVLTVAPLATLLGLFGGITVGLISGYYRGWVDDVVSRLVDALLSIPLVIMAVLVLASLGRDAKNVILVIGIIFTPIIARTVRSAVLAEREREYVAAARLRGERGVRIMAAEILPNITAPILVEATIRLGYAIFTAATLSFLGLGIQEPSPDWGLQIANGRAYLQVAAWMVLFPAAALATLVVGVNLAADGLRRVIED
jgi:peptide/nickel transport system permease protein